MPPNTLFRITSATRATSRQCLRPQTVQSQCRRFKSDEPSKKDQPDLEPIQGQLHPHEPPPMGGKPTQKMTQQERNLLAMELQAAQRANYNRKFERPTKSGRLNQDEEHKSFHPLMVGTVVGLMVAFSLSYIVFHHSGSYHVQKASQLTNELLLKEQKRIATAAEATDLSAEEITGWLRKVSRYYSAFHGNSERFLDAREKEIEKGLAHSKEKAKEVEGIAKECAQELEKKIKPPDMARNLVGGLNTGKQGFMIVMKHLQRIEEAVEGKEEVERRRRRIEKGAAAEGDDVR